LRIEIEREDDGRWIAEVPELPGVMAYGQTREEAISRVQALDLRVIANRLEHGETSFTIEEAFSVCGLDDPGEDCHFTFGRV
jgi:predicted RNase H-like HicB family nuclease